MAVLAMLTRTVWSASAGTSERRAARDRGDGTDRAGGDREIGAAGHHRLDLLGPALRPGDLGREVVARHDALVDRELRRDGVPVSALADRDPDAVLRRAWACP